MSPSKEGLGSGEGEVPCFGKDDLAVVKEAARLAEELTSEAFKMSFSRWRRQRYDIKTLADLRPEEIVYGPFAQIIRYVGHKPESVLGSSHYDFYKICLQDHAILSAHRRAEDLSLFPFLLYILCHELIHVIRFATFQQSFEASAEEKIIEEARVHRRTQEILENASIQGMTTVFKFYRAWSGPIDELQEV